MIFIENLREDAQVNFFNVIQDPRWAKVKKDWNYQYVGVEENQKIIATALILKRKGIWTIHRGPLMDYQNEDVLRYLLTNVLKISKKQRAKIININTNSPLRIDTIKNFQENPTTKIENEKILNIFNELKFSYSGLTKSMDETIQPRFEAIKYLNTDDLLNSFSKDTRRLIRDADKKNVEIKQGSLKLLDDFVSLIQSTETRKGIRLRNKDYFKDILDNFGEDSILTLSYLDIKSNLEDYEYNLKVLETQLQVIEDSNQTKKIHKLKEQIQSYSKNIELLKELAKEFGEKKIPLAGSLTVKSGNFAEMLYAGTNKKTLKIPAQYKVYYKSMEWAKNSNVEVFSMGGIENDFKGNLFNFKKQFADKIIEHYGEFIRYNNLFYKGAYVYGIPFIKKIRKLKNKK